MYLAGNKETRRRADVYYVPAKPMSPAVDFFCYFVCFLILFCLFLVLLFVWTQTLCQSSFFILLLGLFQGSGGAYALVMLRVFLVFPA